MARTGLRSTARPRELEGALAYKQRKLGKDVRSVATQANQSVDLNFAPHSLSLQPSKRFLLCWDPNWYARVSDSKLAQKENSFSNRLK